MKQDCYEPVEIAAARDLPADHPLQLHLETCPACRAIARSYREFMDPTSLRSEHEVDEADAELARRLAEVPGLGAPIQRIGSVRGRDRPVRRSFSRSLLALAATLAVAAGVLVMRDVVLVGGSRVPVGPGVDRGATAGADQPHWKREATGWRVDWSPPGSATGAVVVFFDARMQELARVESDDAAFLELTPGAVLTAATYAQVLFVAQGDTVARSPIVAPR